MARRRTSGSVRLGLGAMVATATVGLGGSAAFACSAVMGPFDYTPTSGPAGTVLKTNATGLKPYPAKYNIYFGGTCMQFNGKLLKTVTTDMNGAWTNVKMTIPKHAQPGTYPLCGVEAYPNMGETATSHGSFTVV